MILAANSASCVDGVSVSMGEHACSSALKWFLFLIQLVLLLSGQICLPSVYFGAPPKGAKIVASFFSLRQANPSNSCSLSPSGEVYKGAAVHGILLGHLQCVVVPKLLGLP